MKRVAIYGLSYIVIFTAILAAFGPASFAEPPLETFGDVRVSGLYSIGEKELLYLLDIRAGGVADAMAIRMGIKRAFNKGIFESISIEREDGGVLVRVIERDRIAKILIRGKKSLFRKFYLNHLILDKRGILRYDLLEKAEILLKEAMADRGFNQASVKLRVEDTDEPYRKTLILEVTEGEPLIIDEISIFGRPMQEVTARMHLDVGSVYDQFRLREDLVRLEAYYRKLGYLAPAVGPYTYGAGTLYLSVYPGKRLTVRFHGNSSIKDRRLREELLFHEAGDVTDDLVEEAASNMASLYRDSGRGAVQIAPVMSEEGDEIRLVFYFYEGDVTTVGKIRFEGNSLPGENLMNIMALKKGGAMSPGLLGADMKSIENFYRALGYLDVSVSEPKVELKGTKADITVSIVEGGRYEIAGIELTGIRSLRESDVRDVIEVGVRSPYNEVDLFDARYAILELYAEHGFRDAKAVVRHEFRENRAFVVFDITEGTRTFFGKTIVKGNGFTRLKVVKRELLHREGMPFQHKLLTRGRHRLYKLSIFSDIDVQAMPVHDATADVVVNVREGKPGAVEFGIGYGEYERYRGFADVSYANLFGLNRRGSLRVELSSIESRYIVKYLEPWFLDRPVRMKSYLLREKKEINNIDTGETRYKLDRWSASVGVEKTLNDRVKAEFVYEFSLVDTYDVMPDVILSKEDTGTLAISGIKPGMVYDTRNDPLDPTRGVFTGFSLKLASEALLSETDFLKLIVHGSTYWPFGRRVVLACSVRVGGAFGFNDTDELPLVERFFLGGRNTVRGYEQDSLGPRGELGTPVGGNAFVLGNLELRVAAGRGWGLVTFLDGGNVWSEIEQVELSEIKYTAGIGVRYKTPVGPFRLDYGHKLDREEGETSGELHFNIGHAF